MTTHRDAAALVAALYAVSERETGRPQSCPGAPEIAWLYRSNLDANVYLGIVRVGRFLFVVPRGSFDFQDWVHDLMARPVKPIGRPTFGLVHGGMYDGTVEAIDIVQLFLRPGDLVVFVGHSLGAAHAGLLAAHMIALGGKPHLIICWGEPLWGFDTMTKLLKDVPGASYVNVVHDIADGVTKLPPPVGYQHRLPLTPVDSADIDLLDVDPFERHHFFRYWKATPETVIPEA